MPFHAWLFFAPSVLILCPYSQIRAGLYSSRLGHCVIIKYFIISEYPLVTILNRIIKRSKNLNNFFLISSPKQALQNVPVDKENFKVSLRSLSTADLQSQDSVLPVITNGYSVFTDPQDDSRKQLYHQRKMELNLSCNLILDHRCCDVKYL